MTTVSSSTLSATAAAFGGLDVNSLVSQLVSAERAPRDKILATQQTAVQANVSAWGKIMSALSTLQTGMGGISDPNLLQAMTATSSNTNILAATVGSGAVTATYAVQVNQLAQASKLASAAYVDPTATGVGTGTLTLSSSGNSFSVNIAAGGDSLNAIRDAINTAAANTSVTASIVQATDGAHLMLASRATGAASQISVTASAGLGALAYNPASATNGLVVKSVAQDALAVVDGFTRSSSTNTISNVAQGVSLNLVSASPGTTVNLSVGASNSSIVSAIQAMVSNYNALDGQIGASSGYNATTKVAGPLQGDSLVRGLATQLRNAFMSSVSGTDPGVTSLLDIGVSLDKNGAMSLDASKLQSVLTSSPSSVIKLLSGTSGLASRVNTVIKAYNTYGTGLISSRQTSLQGQLSDIQKKQSALDVRMQQVQARYTAQFTALNSMISNMQQTGNFLTAQLAKL